MLTMRRTVAGRRVLVVVVRGQAEFCIFVEWIGHEIQCGARVQPLNVRPGAAGRRAHDRDPCSSP